MNHPNHYRDKEVVILGLAKSGRAVAKVFQQSGAKVTVNDIKERNLCPEADELEALGISIICGQHPKSLIHSGISLLVKNPGVPYSAAPVVQALELGIEIVTEVEVAYQISGANIIGITGSNGKTTTTTWVGEMLKAAQLSPIIAGNIGKPLCEAALEADKNQWMVVELSSFQLKGIDQFRPRISCLLNIVETHLDYHGTFEDYVASKANLFRKQTEEDIAVINWDDTICRQLIPQVKAKIIPFSMTEALESGVFLRSVPLADHHDERIIYRDREGKEHEVIQVRELGIPGRHNVENALASVAIAVAAGVDFVTMKEVLMNFKGVEHRLEFVHSINNVTFYNDSKATNPAATIKALQAFEKNIILIAGGLDRGSDYKELKPWFEAKVKGVVALGETKRKIEKVAEMARISLVYSVDNDKNAQQSINQAVKMAFSYAKSGDVILLSPACASWDMFPSYEDRGRMFKESVHNLL